MVFWLSGCVCCVMFYYSMRSCVRSQLMYFFSSNNNYVIQKYALSPEGMFANTRFSREQCWQTLLFVLRENVCKYLTQTAHGRVYQLEDGDVMHAHKLNPPQSDSHDMSFVWVCIDVSDMVHIDIFLF
jgi:hypothetical protein